MLPNLFPVHKWLLAITSCLILFAACNRDEEVISKNDLTASFDNEVVLKWHELILDVERFTPGYLPPVAARAYAYIGLAAYETAVPGMPDYKSFRNYYANLSLPQQATLDIHYPAALNSAYLTIIQKLFPTAPSAQLSKIISLNTYFNQKFEKEMTPTKFAASKDWGKSVADAVFNWSQSDFAGHEGFLHNTDPAYNPPTGPGLWKPTYPNYGSALLPHWGKVRTFAATTDDRCKPPLPYSTEKNSEFYTQALETTNKVNLIKKGQNYEDKWIAEFWSDDCPALTFSPAGRWVAIASQSLQIIKADLAKSIIVMAKVSMAVCDAGIRCWGEKYRYNVLRPVEYIHNVIGDASWNSIMCPDGSGQFFTPQFPSYPSGHGTFGAAAAEVLTFELGNYFELTDKCHQARTEFIGTPRSFYNFYEMAQENAYSRLPIGVHFRMDSEAALALGYSVGRKVNALPWK